MAVRAAAPLRTGISQKAWASLAVLTLVPLASYLSAHVGVMFVGVLLVGAAGAATILRWPSCGLLAVVVFTSTVLSDSDTLFRVGLGRIKLLPSEAILLLLLARVVRPFVPADTHRKYFTAAGLAFGGLLFVSLSSALASWLFRDEPLFDNLVLARPMALYGLYFAARSILKDTRTFKRLMYALLTIGLLTAIIYDLVVLTSLRGLLAQYPWIEISTSSLEINQTLGDVEAGRVYMPGRALVQLLFFPALVCMLVLPRGAHLGMAIATTLLFGVTIVLIFTRTVWITTLFMVIFLPIFLPHRRRYIITKLMLFVVCAVTFTSALIAFSGLSSRTSSLEVIGNRFLTIFQDNVHDQNAQHRLSEAQEVRERLGDRWDNWIIGAGFRAPLREGMVYEADKGWHTMIVGVWHNGYLSLLKNTGLIGVGFFVLLGIVIMRDAWVASRLRSGDVFVWACSVGFGVSLMRILLNGLTESTFDDYFTVPLIALSCAFLERGVALTRAGNAGPSGSGGQEPGAGRPGPLGTAAAPVGRSGEGGFHRVARPLVAG